VDWTQMSMNGNYTKLLVVLLSLVCVHSVAAPLVVGDAIPCISAKDQRGVDYILTTNVQYLLVATEMDCAKAANHKLADQGTNYLEPHQAVYLMDIHRMPAIARVFALPKMKKYPERIILIDTPGALAWVPVQAGKITVLVLTPEGRIRKISFWDPANEPVADVFQ
jgi:hypothetical protein